MTTQSGFFLESYFGVSLAVAAEDDEHVVSRSYSAVCSRLEVVVAVLAEFFFE